MLQKQDKRIWDTPLYADFPRTEYEDRVSRARQYMSERNLDVLVLWDPANIRYFSGLSFAPLSNRGPRQTNSFTYLHIAQTICRKQDNPKPAAQAARHRTGADIGFNLIAFSLPQFDTWRTAPTLRHLTPPVQLN